MEDLKVEDLKAALEQECDRHGMVALDAKLMLGVSILSQASKRYHDVARAAGEKRVGLKPRRLSKPIRLFAERWNETPLPTLIALQGEQSYAALHREAQQLRDKYDFLSYSERAELMPLEDRLLRDACAVRELLQVLNQHGEDELHRLTGLIPEEMRALAQDVLRIAQQEISHPTHDEPDDDDDRSGGGFRALLKQT